MCFRGGMREGNWYAAIIWCALDDFCVYLAFERFGVFTSCGS